MYKMSFKPPIIHQNVLQYSPLQKTCGTNIFATSFKIIFFQKLFSCERFIGGANPPPVSSHSKVPKWQLSPPHNTFFACKVLNMNCFKLATWLVFILNGPSPGSFLFIFGLFKTNITILMCKMSIQYTVLGIEPRTFRLRVSSNNHQARDHALVPIGLWTR